MLPVNSGGHTAYQDFLLVNLRKHYPVPDSISPSTWDIIDRFWNLDLSFTDEFMRDKYSVFGPKQELLPVCSVPSCCLLISRFPHSQIGLHSSKSIPFMPYSVALSLGIPLASVLFMTSLNRFIGILILTISPHYIHPVKSQGQKAKNERLQGCSCGKSLCRTAFAGT